MDSWSRLNQNLSEQLIQRSQSGLSQHNQKASNYRVLAYLGVFHALEEIVTGLAKLYPHKRKVLYFTNQSPFFSSVALGLARDGLMVEGVESVEKLKSAIEISGKELLLVMTAADDLVTAEIFNTHDRNVALKEQKIFNVVVSHQKHIYEPFPETLHPFDIFIHSCGAHNAIAILGERAKINPIVASRINWSSKLNCDFELYYGSKLPDSRVVLDFESSELQLDKSQLFKPLFNSAHPRVYDRAVIYWEDLDGSAVIEEMAKAGYLVGSQLETTSSCRWLLNPFKWLKQKGLSDNQLRGLVIVDRDLLFPEFTDALKRAVDRILRMSRGDAVD